MKIVHQLLSAVLLFTIVSCSSNNVPVRKIIPLNNNWKSMAADSNLSVNDQFSNTTFNDTTWENVNIPHNWDRYHGYLRKVHGNYHGTAWYRKSFSVERGKETDRYFLFFEGVGSYATVWVNGQKAGYHAGGRTTFTIDITNFIRFNQGNILAVQADHPSEIRDLPWVCGGCSSEVGFSEGSQPMGIFRPVSLVITNEVRIEPFGIHIWNDTNVTEKHAQLNINTELKNYSSETKSLTVTHQLLNGKKQLVKAEAAINVEANTTITNPQQLNIKHPNLWSPDKPHLYTLKTSIFENGQLIDQVETPYGIRTISWPVSRTDSSGQFLVNGKPVFINGVGEYEHMFGNSHAFTNQQIDARVAQIKAAGFNAFRDAHQPHNLRYQEHFDEEGILWWTQLSAHVWFDTPEFRENFKTLLREWVKERRNNPSNIVWGLQNESTLPTDFSKECTDIIREMDPTTSSQRIVTTCNGGTGTDWNVVQNWSGTYGGKPENYDNEISEQLMNGEYGAWRSLDLHTEGPYQQNGALSEDRMAQLLQMKARLAESVSDKVCGQFLWIFSSHDNPGRIQSGEALRDIDRVGPVNYKGLFTPWAEPLDVFYMYRSQYASVKTDPMVYIVSHTWPNRWTAPGMKDSITVYSNCDEVELFNGYNNQSLGKFKNPGFGIPFIWKKAEIKHNLLYAKGFVDGKAVAEDMIVLHHLPESPDIEQLKTASENRIQSDKTHQYLYRVNCGGRDYTDTEGNVWLADRPLKSKDTWGSTSWSDKFDGLPDIYGSQRRTFDPITGTADWELIQHFRYGMQELSYQFPVPDGEYQVELFFTEPWYGTGGGMNCKDWRIFDVAVNNHIVINDLAIWQEAGHDNVLKKVVHGKAHNGLLIINFPEVLSGQAIISAIAIASTNKDVKPAPASPLVISDLTSDQNWKIQTWLDWGQQQFTDSDAEFHDIPSILFGANWIQTSSKANGKKDTTSFKVTETADVFIALTKGSKKPSWMAEFIQLDISISNHKGMVYDLYSTRFRAHSTINLGNPSGENNYTVFVVPASKLDAPSDQRPVTNYNVKDAEVSGPAKRRLVKGRHYVEFIESGEVKIKWSFQVGLASTYGVHFKFQNNTPGTAQADMLIETATGIEMHHETVEMYHKPTKWRTVKTSTGTTINAGTYFVTLTFKNCKDLLIQRMEIQ